MSVCVQAPFIHHGDVCLADSTFILDYLTNTYADQIKVKASTDAKQAGVAVAVQRLCEDHLLYGIVWVRFVRQEVAKGMVNSSDVLLSMRQRGLYGCCGLSYLRNVDAKSILHSVCVVVFRGGMK